MYNIFVIDSEKPLTGELNKYCTIFFSSYDLRRTWSSPCCPFLWVVDCDRGFCWIKLMCSQETNSTYVATFFGLCSLDQICWQRKTESMEHWFSETEATPMLVRYFTPVWCRMVEGGTSCGPLWLSAQLLPNGRLARLWSLPTSFNHLKQTWLAVANSIRSSISIL